MNTNFSRRRFIKTVSTAAAFAAGGWPVRALAKGSRPANKVIIVGAGFAGLKLARLLAGSMFQVLLIDKQNFHQFQFHNNLSIVSELV